MYKNLRKYSYEQLKIKLESVKQDLISLKQTLEYIPETSVLGYVAITATIAKKNKLYADLKDEIAFREFKMEENENE